MQRYLRLSEAKLTLDKGQQIEQLLSPYRAGDEQAIRYATIRRDKDKIVATVFEVIQPIQASLTDVSRFMSVKSTPPDEFYFDTLEEACFFLEYRNGASWGKFMHQGMLSEEYRDFRAGKLSP